MMGGQECIGDGAIRMVEGKPEMVKCRFWVVVQGKNPQDGTVTNNGDCAFCWTPVLLIENSKVNRETGAAVESLRNEAATAQQLTQSLMGGIVQAIGQVQQSRIAGPGEVEWKAAGPNGSAVHGGFVQIEGDKT
ncbi:MAG TPA: hypothetical protein DCK83_07200 [Gallionellaceae bacterium]|nr:hypothetical protein [Gallionellaceae bacterium]